MWVAFPFYPTKSAPVIFIQSGGPDFTLFGLRLPATILAVICRAYVGKTRLDVENRSPIEHV
jgi:hypothetical protein